MSCGGPKESEAPKLPLTANRAKGEVQIGDFIITPQLLGQGSFGSVYVGFNAHTGDKIAVKNVKFQQNANATSEVWEHRKTNHKNIIRLLDQKKNSKELVMFFEFCGGGNLDSLIRSTGPLPEIVAQRFFKELCSGLYYLKSINMLHRDLKSANVLLTTTDMFAASVRIADLGFAKTIEDLTSTTLGSPAFKSPERLLENPYGFPAEVYGAGLILFQMMTGDYAFKGATLRTLLDHQKKRECLAHPLLQNYSAEAQDVLRRTLTFMDSERITIEDLMEHPFVTGRPKADAEEETLSSQPSSAAESEEGSNRSKLNKFVPADEPSSFPAAPQEGKNPTTTIATITYARLVRGLAYEEEKELGNMAVLAVLYSYCCSLLITARQESEEARLLYKECYDQAHRNKQQALHASQIIPEHDAGAVKVCSVVRLLVLHASNIYERALCEQLSSRQAMSYERAHGLLTLAAKELASPTSGYPQPKDCTKWKQRVELLLSAVKPKLH